MAEDRCPDQEALQGYCTGQLPNELQADLERHLARCGTCQAMIETFDTRSDTLIGELRLPASSDEFRDESGLRRLLADAARLIHAPTQDDNSPAEWTPSSVHSSSAAPSTAEQFAAAVIASGVLSESAIRDFLAALPTNSQPTDGKSLAFALVKAGKLTPFQARAIYLGFGHGLTLGDREILDLIGRGGMGHVYRARHRRLDRIEAVKVLSAERLNSPQAVARFEREARAAAKVEHAHVVRTYDAGEQHGAYYLAMEYVEGQDLSTFVRAHGPLPLPQAITCMIEAARGLQAAHDANIIHRDVKPHNLLVGSGERGVRNQEDQSAFRTSHSAIIKVLDLGLARIAGDAARLEQTSSTVTSDGQIMGTLDYISPEQVLDTHTADARSDIYSLGCTFYFLLTGRPPYEANHPIQKIDAHRSAPIPKVAITLRRDEPSAANLPESERSPNTNAPNEEAHHAERDGYIRLNAALEQLLAKSPADRPQTMNDVITLLESIAPPEPVVYPGASADTIDHDLDAYLTQPNDGSFIHFPALAPATPPTPFRLPRRRHIPRIALAFALGFLPILVLGVIVLKFNTPMGDVEIVFPNQAAADSVEIALLQGGKQVKVAKPGEWEFKLEEGRYDIQMQAGDDRFQLDNGVLSVTKGDQPALIRVSIRPTENPPQDELAEEVHNVTNDTLEPGKWYDVLSLVEVDRHPIDSIWKRTTDGLKTQYIRAGRLVVPVQVHGSYEVDFAFTRLAGDDTVQFGLPVGDYNCTKLILSGWNGVVSGIGWYDGAELSDKPRSEAVVRPGRLQNFHRYAVHVRVELEGELATINVKLDGRQYLKWHGRADSVATHANSALPRTDLLAIGTHYTPITVHGVKLRPLDLPATRWKPEQTFASAPPDEIRDQCIEWNGHWYWMSDEKLGFNDAAALASKYSGKLLEVSSDREQDFITAQWPYRETWLGVWRSGSDLDAKTGWLNSHLKPVGYIGRWGGGQPSQGGAETNLAISTDGYWHDYDNNVRLFTCIEWGNESDPPPSDDTPIEITPLKPPSEFRLQVNGLGGKQYFDPVVWTKKWVEDEAFAHICGPGDLVYPACSGFNYAMDFDVTVNRGHHATVRIAFGDLNDANALLQFDSGYDNNPQDRVDYRIWNWLNEGHWHWGNCEAKAGERLRLSLLVTEGHCALVMDGKVIHRGHSPPADPMLRIEGTSAGTDVLIHHLQLRPLTQGDCDGVGWKLPAVSIPFVESESPQRLAETLEGLVTEYVAGSSSLVADVQMPLVWIKPGAFNMGVPTDDATKIRPVRISKGFWLGQHEVTRREWKTFMDDDPSRITGSAYLPVECVSYDDALLFCTLLTQKERELGRLPDGYEFRLPTEAEWEYAARAGRTELVEVPDNENWSPKTSDWRPHEVCESEPNPWGLYDLIGNVPEWCLDAWGDLPLVGRETTDPFRPPTQWRERRIVRGGWWGHHDRNTIHDRWSHYPVSGGYRGFRIVLGPVLTDQIPKSALPDDLAKLIGKEESETQPPPNWPTTDKAMPASGEVLKNDVWYDILPAIDVEHDAINGYWTRKNGEIVATPASDSRIALPIQVKTIGEYELAFSFQRLSGNNHISALLPVGDYRLCLTGFAAWTNRHSGIYYIGEKSFLDHPPAASFRRDIGLTNRRQYFCSMRVRADWDEVAISTELDGQPFVSWQGNRSELGIDPVRSLPSMDLLGLVVHASTAAFSEIKFRQINGTAIHVDLANRAFTSTPPAELAKDCINFSKSFYWLSPTATNFAEAQALANRQGATLLNLSSQEEYDFIASQWLGKSLWLSAWRNGNEPDPRIGWLDEKLQPLKFFPTWEEGQPEGIIAHSALWLDGRFRLLHDASPNDDRAYAVLEWGPEAEAE